MTTIKNFEDLIAWQKARELAVMFMNLLVTINSLVTLGCEIKFNVRQVLSCITLPKGLNRDLTRSLCDF
jgi:hypothetical protein